MPVVRQSQKLTENADMQNVQSQARPVAKDNTRYVQRQTSQARVTMGCLTYLLCFSRSDLGRKVDKHPLALLCAILHDHTKGSV